MNKAFHVLSNDYGSVFCELGNLLGRSCLGTDNYCLALAGETCSANFVRLLFRQLLTQKTIHSSKSLKNSLGAF